MVRNCDRAPEFVVASLGRVGDDVLRWAGRGPDARRGLVGHRRRPGILCKGSLRRIGGSKKHRPVSVVGRDALPWLGIALTLLSRAESRTDWLAGDAVPIAPVSGQNSLLTGNFTGK